MDADRTMPDPKSTKAYKDPKLPPPLDLPEGPNWVNALCVLNPDQAETLFAATRTLYPHDRLPDRIYRRVVAELDRKAAASSEIAGFLADCVMMLDANFPVLFRERSESYRIAALVMIEGSEAFRFLQRGTIRHLYDDIEVWAAFGYEGASVHLGGYIERGFDDLDWLPGLPAGI
jgi:hypothetical protein